MISRGAAEAEAGARGVTTQQGMRRSRTLGGAWTRREAPVQLRCLFGFDVVAARSIDALRLIDDRLERGERLKVAFLNAHGVNIAAGRADFRAALADTVMLNDGIGVAVAAWMLEGRGFPENLNGTDFTPFFLATTRHRFRIYLLGAKPGVAEKVAEEILKRAPQHQVVGLSHGYFDRAEETSVAERIRVAGADLVLVALGNPAQELFIDRQFAATGCRLAMAVGGLFDFMAGEKPRAPRILQRIGLEWLFRLGVEPARMWRRYILGNPVFLSRVAAEWVRMRFAR